MSNWNEHVCNILTDVRINSIYLSEYHRNRFYKFKSFSKYFDLPILVISAVSSSFAVGAQPYLSQGVISLVSCATGVVVSVIVSVKLYLNINESMNLELKCSKEFYTLAIDINRVLSLCPEDRGEDGINYLNKKYSLYTKLVENSNLLRRRFKEDRLTQANGLLHFDDSSTEESKGEKKELELVSNI